MEFMMTVLIVFSHFSLSQAETLWEPSVTLVSTIDDNIQFSRTEPVDDFIITLEPALRFDYNQELTRLSTKASVYFRRYQDNDDFNDEVYNFNLNGIDSRNIEPHKRR